MLAGIFTSLAAYERELMHERAAAVASYFDLKKSKQLPL